jgi:DUF1365 family protein
VVSPSLYETTIHHVRQSPLKHAFTYKSYWWAVDLDDLPSYGPLASFRASDHVGTEDSLRTNIDKLLADRGLSCDRVLMLCNARVLGHVFNPLSLHYCLADGAVVAVVAEVHNTYGGRHCYLLRTDEAGRASTDKDFYVSPFLTVAGDYAMRLPEPGDRLALSITLRQGGRTALTVTLVGDRRPATPTTLARTLLRRPFVTHRTSAQIRRHGIALWLRRLPVIPRPEHEPQEGVQ